MKEKKQQLLLNILLLFVLLQPVLDILSRLAILNVIPNISTYIKPLFVFGITAYLLLFYSPKRKKWLIYSIIFFVFTLGHLYILYLLLTTSSVILHELRFMINIYYMVALFISFETICYYSKDKGEMYKKIKKTLFYTFMLYFIFYILSVLTNTAGMTYEYSDSSKVGFKGWYDSGQIFGHAIAIVFPILLYNLLKVKTNKVLRVIFLALTLTVVSLLGTKASYFVILLVLIIYLIIVFVLKFINKDFKRNYFNIILVIIAAFSMLLTYKYTPVYHNSIINNNNLKSEIDSYNLEEMAGKQRDLEEVRSKNKDRDLSYYEKYYEYGEEAKDYLIDLFYAKKVHPSNNRERQFFYNYKKYMVASFDYKLFGIGFLNQQEIVRSDFSIEGDFFMAIFSFGILGFILFLGIPILIFIKSLIFILKNIRKIDLETYMLFMGLGIFFSISIFVGYTYIYTNFSIYLVIILSMLNFKIESIQGENLKKVKSVSFLSLHLGYGGIESAVINSANSLSHDYDVEIVSFYNLKKNSLDKLNDNIKIKFLYNGEPNRDKFMESLKEKRIFSLIKEGLKSCYILILKKLLIIKSIIFNKNDCIVSTRVEFNVLLSKYGKKDTLKIACEHCYHNNNKKYINKIKNKYYNIDYLCALTSTLESDYKKFLAKNMHTKVVLLPNMIVNIGKEKSDLSKVNLITVSRLDYLKRNDLIIEMFSKIKNKDSKLFIIGDGQEYNNLKKEIEDLKLNDKVFLLGYKDNKEQVKYYLDSSIFLMASTTEGLPMVLLEAMSYGLPCIAFKTASGTNDIITDNSNGYLIEDRNQEKYIASIDKLLSDKKLREEFGKKAFKSIDKFREENILKIWKKILSREI